jgi:hypothetical protein
MVETTVVVRKFRRLQPCGDWDRFIEISRWLGAQRAAQARTPHRSPLFRWNNGWAAARNFGEIFFY